MAKLSGPYAIPDEHVALIGRIAEAWAQLEFIIDQAIWHLSGTEQQLAACITSQLISVHPKLRAFTALASICGGSQNSVNVLKSFTGSISGLSEKRNRTVHDPRYKAKASGEIYRLEITAKPKVQFGFVPEPPDGLQKTIDQIYEKVYEFIALRDVILDEIDKLPETSQPTLLRIVPVQRSKPNQPTDAQGS